MYISICICTYRRPHVVATVRSVQAQTGLKDVQVEIVVCDDDPEGSASSIVEELAVKSSVPLRYVKSGSRNVATCRNKCIGSAKGDWIAFIDDDEIAEPRWLSELVAAQAKYGADVVKGCVRAVYPESTPLWIRAGDPFTRDYGPTGTQLQLAASGNVFFRRSLATESGIVFNAYFGRTGGEDTDFFARLRRIGASLISCREAIVHEIVPASRVSRDYLAQRYRRQGRTALNGLLEGRTPAGLIRFALRAALALLLGIFLPFVEFSRGRWSYWIFTMFWYYLGATERLFGAKLLQLDETS